MAKPLPARYTRGRYAKMTSKQQRFEYAADRDQALIDAEMRRRGAARKASGTELRSLSGRLL